MAKTTRHIGLCPVCERAIKVRDGLLVHHGYQRPGHGYIVGDCFGVHKPPFELSPDTAIEFQEEVIDPMLEEAERKIAQLDEWTEVPTKVLNRRTWRREEKIVHRVDVSPTEWARLIEEQGKSLLLERDALQREHDRLVAMIESWRPEPLQTVEQEKAQKRTAREQREGKQRQRREEKIAEMVVKYQKRIDSAVRSQNMDTLARIHEGARRKIREASNYELTASDALSVLDRAEVWEAFGLYAPATGYLVDPFRKGGYIEEGPMTDILTAMGGGSYRVPAMEWPAALGEAKPQRRRRR